MTTKEISNLTLAVARDEAVCHHHWLIEVPDGPVSRGKCRLCGGTQEFKNVIESIPYGQDSSDLTAEETIKVIVPSNDSDDLEDE